MLFLMLKNVTQLRKSQTKLRKSCTRAVILRLILTFRLKAFKAVIMNLHMELGVL